MKKFLSLVSLLLLCAMVLGACSGDGGSGSDSTTPSAGSSGSTPDGENAGGPSEDYTFRTSDTNKVVTENGTFTKENVSGTVLVTSVGQSADVSMLDALMKKVGADYTFNATASADEVTKYKTVIIACGASSKGLGAAGISKEDEIARAEAIVKAVKDSSVTVIMAHLGGTARRGALSDQFSDMVMDIASYVMVVEDGNDDGKFTDGAKDQGIPITLLHSIADAMTPLTELFGN